VKGDSVNQALSFNGQDRGLSIRRQGFDSPKSRHSVVLIKACE
jgi:hypothetical protein